VRGVKVILDSDLAAMYGVETRVLNQAVSRNIKRFPEDFIFALTHDEILRISQIVTSQRIKFSKRVRVFTELGVAMLSSVLKSGQAIEVNIAIMRAFTQLRRMLSTHEDLKRKIEGLEKKYDEQFAIVFKAIQMIIEEDQNPRKKIGNIKEQRERYGKKSQKRSFSEANK
jgi:hypothetical protein